MLILLKVLYAWLLPPGIFILALLAVYCFSNKAKRNRRLLAVAVFMYLLSISVVSDNLVKPLEDRYTQPDLRELQHAQAIVVLAGGGYDGVPDFDGVGQNSADSMNRLAMGLRLHRVLHVPVILSGGRIFDDTETEANNMYRFLKACGVEERFLIKEDRSRNTTENAVFTKQICQEKGFESVIVVTSAYHMPRSVVLFERVGMKVADDGVSGAGSNVTGAAGQKGKSEGAESTPASGAAADRKRISVIPYPTDYKTDKQIRLNVFAFTPSADAVRTSSVAMKEYLGYFAAKLGVW